MLIRLGYVAMSMEIKNASPSKTMTATRFLEINDREAGLRKLERLAEENLHNTLRLLYHNKANGIQIYRFSSKLIPLIGHSELAGWNPIPDLLPSFRAIGDYVKQHKMRVSFHPEHFTVLSTPRPDVLRSSVADLDRHVEMLESMGLGEHAKCNIHIGGSYGNKEKSLLRFHQQFGALPERIRNRVTLENDDKTYTAAETLTACEKLGVPMVLDVHHHAVNHHEGENIAELWPRVLRTWDTTGLPPKIHVSSPKSEKDKRSHADFVDLESLLPFLSEIAPITDKLDIMIEAKMKDRALFRLMGDLRKTEGVRPVTEASVELL